MVNGMKRLVLSMVILLSIVVLSSFSSNLSSNALAQESEEVSILNGVLQANRATWVARDNPVSQLSLDEKLKHLGSKTPVYNEKEAASHTIKSSAKASATQLPATFDWRNNNGLNYVTAPRDQENCGACWAFASTEALESQVLINYPNVTGLNVFLSPQVLVSSGTSGNCNGGAIDSAANYIENTGLPPEACFPYTQMNSNESNACPEYTTDVYQIVGNTNTTSAWVWVSNPTTNINNTGNAYATPDQLKSAIYTYGPIVVTMRVYYDFFSYGSGVYQYTWGGYVGNHAILAVGWDDTNQCFIVKNSWAASWGENGYFRIAYSEVSTVTQFGENAIAYTSATTANKTKPLADFYIESPTTYDDGGVMFLVTTGSIAVTFQDTSTSSDPSDPITSWYWNFGDGTTSTEQNPTHTFDLNVQNQYTVSLEVGNSAGIDTVTFNNMIMVLSDILPIAGFVASATSGPPPLKVQFTSTDTGAPATEGYCWVFGDGATSTSQNPTHTFMTAGAYWVSMCESSFYGSSCTSQRITVAAPPVVGITATTLQGNTHIPVQFTTTSSGIYIVYIQWDFGDGTTSNFSASSQYNTKYNTFGSMQAPLHIYKKAGMYPVTVTVNGALGVNITKQLLVAVYPKPIAKIAANHKSGKAPLLVHFTSKSTGTISSYLWSFGDGQTSSAKNTSHVYTSSGTYTATLTVTGPGGTSTEGMTVVAR